MDNDPVSFKKAVESEVYQKVLNGNPKNHNAAMKAYILDKLKAANGDKKEFFRIIRELKLGTSFDGREELNAILEEMRAEYADITRPVDDHDIYMHGNKITTADFNYAINNNWISNVEAVATYSAVCVAEGEDNPESIQKLNH